MGPAGRRLHIAHRRSPSELTPLMSKCYLVICYVMASRKSRVLANMKSSGTTRTRPADRASTSTAESTCCHTSAICQHGHATSRSDPELPANTRANECGTSGQSIPIPRPDGRKSESWYANECPTRSKHTSSESVSTARCGPNGSSTSTQHQSRHVTTFTPTKSNMTY